MAHARPADDAARAETGITRLVAAERQWKERVERAAAEGRLLVAEARAAEAAAESALEREIVQSTAARAAATRAAMHERCAALRRQAEERAARYEEAGAELESRIAREIADRLWGITAPARQLVGGGA